MCGIAGQFNYAGGARVEAETLSAMLGVLRHRGPDEAGIYRDGAMGLAHARLSIIDLSGGRQPISNEDASVWITYNGEVFNYPELRTGLEARGHRFSTKTDTEVIVHLYEEHGTDCLRYLNGQFAFALWDRRKQQLMLARDRLGIRPLFYANVRGSFTFASEAKAIFAAGAVAPALDPVGLDQFFTFWATIPPVTTFQGIEELPPAHFLTVDRTGLTTRRYWDLDFASSRPCASDPDACCEELLDLLVDSIRIRLRADVPVAAYLSGGLDSSLITALTRRYFSNRLQTFSVGFTSKGFDESSFQRQVARYLGTEHHEISCTPADIGAVMPEVIWHAEKPLVRTAPAPLFMLSQLVRDSGIKVVLTGEGADEVFAGYDLFREMRIRRFWARQPGSSWRPHLLSSLYRAVPDWPRQAPAYLEAFYRGTLSGTERPTYSHVPRWKTTSWAKNFFSAEFKERLAGLDCITAFERSLPAAFSSWDHLGKAQYIETVTLLAGNLLSSQGDRMVMAHSVEGRMPFLDYRIVEYGASLPPGLKLKGLNEKYILKRIGRPFLPPEITARPKQAYRSPDAASFFGPRRPEYMADLLSEGNIRSSGCFDAAAVAALVRKCERSPNLIGTRENIAVVGVLTTLLAERLFVRDFARRAGAGQPTFRVHEYGPPALAGAGRSS